VFPSDAERQGRTKRIGYQSNLEIGEMVLAIAHDGGTEDGDFPVLVGIGHGKNKGLLR
jgi:hypothetical protein